MPLPALLLSRLATGALPVVFSLLGDMYDTSRRAGVSSMVQVGGCVLRRVPQASQLQLRLLQACRHVQTLCSPCHPTPAAGHGRGAGGRAGHRRICGPRLGLAMAFCHRQHTLSGRWAACVRVHVRGQGVGQLAC